MILHNHYHPPVQVCRKEKEEFSHNFWQQKSREFSLGKKSSLKPIVLTLRPPKPEISSAQSCTSRILGMWIMAWLVLLIPEHCRTSCPQIGTTGCSGRGLAIPALSHKASTLPCLREPKSCPDSPVQIHPHNKHSQGGSGDQIIQSAEWGSG